MATATAATGSGSAPFLVRLSNLRRLPLLGECRDVRSDAELPIVGSICSFMRSP